MYKMVIYLEINSSHGNGIHSKAFNNFHIYNMFANVLYCIYTIYCII